MIMSLNLRLTGANELTLDSPSGGSWIEARGFIVWFLVVISYIIIIRSMMIARKIWPLSDLDEFTKKSRARIEDLFAKAGVSDDVAAELRIF